MNEQTEKEIMNFIARHTRKFQNIYVIDDVSKFANDLNDYFKEKYKK